MSAGKLDHKRCAVVRTGTANIASVCAALGRSGLEAHVTCNAREIERAELLVLPGVGSFAAARAALDACGVVESLRDRLLAGRATLGICLGFQLLFGASEESAGVAGLGVLPGSVGRFRGGDGVRVPQMGWNEVSAPDGCRVLSSGWAYFANSYRVEAGVAMPTGWVCARATHGEAFVAGVEGFGGRVVACQGHPELSGAWGRGVIERWAAAAREGVAPC